MDKMAMPGSQDVSQPEWPIRFTWATKAGQTHLNLKEWLSEPYNLLQFLQQPLAPLRL
jgi:hypothetical protein